MTIIRLQRVMTGREFAPRLVALFEQYPSVTETGPPQSGRTTPCRAAFPHLDDRDPDAPDKRDSAETHPGRFLARSCGSAIPDEARASSCRARCARIEGAGADVAILIRCLRERTGDPERHRLAGGLPRSCQVRVTRKRGMPGGAESPAQYPERRSRRGAGFVLADLKVQAWSSATSRGENS